MIPTFPRHILALVAELEQAVLAATAPERGDGQRELSSIRECEIEAQLSALGWGAVLNEETQHWVPILCAYTIVHNLPDSLYYPQRCYPLPEHPARWEYLWEGKVRVGLPNWMAAYAFVFAYDRRERSQLPRKHFCVRLPGTCGGNEYVATSAGDAERMHRNYWLDEQRLTPTEVVNLPLQVFEHSGGRTVYCSACQHAPCAYAPPPGQSASDAPTIQK
jgi:hypothetical protein